MGLVLCSFGKWKLVRSCGTEGSTSHVQGIDFDSNVLWVTSVNSTNRKGYLREFSFVSGEMIRAVEVQQDEGFSSWRDRCDAESVWIPVAKYHPNSSRLIQKRSARTICTGAISDGRPYRDN